MSTTRRFGFKDFQLYFKEKHLECINGYFHENSMQNVFMVTGSDQEVAEFLSNKACQHKAPVLMTDQTDFALIMERISDQMIKSRNYGVMSDKISSVAAQYNEELEEKYRSAPPAYTIVVPIGAILYCYERLEPEKTMTGNEKLNEIEEKFIIEIERQREEQRKYQQNEKEKFENRIEKDPEFALCTTKDLRRSYMTKIIRDKGDWFCEVYSGEGGLTKLTLDAVGTRIYNRLKANKNRKK